MSSWVGARGLGAFAALLLAVWVAAWQWARLPSWTALSDGERAAIMGALRAAADGRDAGTVALAAAQVEPVIVTLYDRGQSAARLIAHGATLGAAVADAAHQLAALPADLRARGRLKVDIVRGRGPVLTFWPLAFAVSLVPGLDGIGAVVDGRDVWVLPDDLMRADLLASGRPVPDLELEIGADLDGARALLTQAAGRPVGAAPLFRFRSEAFVERAHQPGAALPVLRGNLAAVPGVTAAALTDGALAGGRYLLRHLGPDGRFEYEYQVDQDKPHAADDDYSLPRHAGSVYFLSQLYAATHDPAVRDGVERALWYARGLTSGACDKPGRACVGDQVIVDLGSSAMALLAAVEYQRATGDAQFLPWMRRLAAFLLFMQKHDGDFCHLYRPIEDRRDEKTKLLYYSGEATLALAKLAALDAEPDASRWAAAADRGLDYLTGAAYDYLAGQFYFGEDHWTCMAADTVWDRLSDPARRRYATFCDQFGAFLRRMQFTPSDAASAAHPDFVGAYGMSPILPLHSTPVGSRSETAISIWRMDRRLGRDAEAAAARQQVLYGMQFLLARQITDDSAWLMPDPEAARGGLTMSDAKRYVRIDFIQHSCSAMLRAIELL